MQNGKAEISTTDESKDATDYPRRSSKFVDLPNDPQALFKRLGSIQLFVGFGVLLGALSPSRTAALTVAGLALVPPIVRTVLYYFNLVSNPDKEKIIKGRFTCARDDSFVVFLIGARNNGAIKLSNDYKEMGDAMQAMLTELEAHPELGCLGVESYSGTGDGSDGLLVQYWKSTEHLQRYAQSNTTTHLTAWKRFMAVVKRSDDIGIWHETFTVQKGEFEAIYANLPRIHLAAARGSIIQKIAGGRTQTMQGRLSKGTGDVKTEWPEQVHASEY